MSYVALMFLSELDENYYAGVRSVLKDEYEEMNCEIPVEYTSKKHMKDEHKKGIHCFDKFLFKFNLLIKYFYDILYFHMTPYFIFLCIMVVQERMGDYMVTIDKSKFDWESFKNNIEKMKEKVNEKINENTL